MSKNIVSVYDTITKRYVEIEAKRSAHITIEPNGILMTTINRSISTRSSSLR